ncbi:MAG: hypothetical protein L0K86_13160 [Actinomycetia bacterium]|nr:hypothetical protein [Actinomycetes bacterium]
MMTHEFVLVLDRRADDEEIDALFDAGCDDATPVREDGRTMLQFDRESESLVGALVSALYDVERAGLKVASVRSDDLVSLREIANRAGRSYESVRLLANGSRGSGGFPPPLSADNWVVYSWSQVGPWFARHLPETEGDHDYLNTPYDRILAAADHLVRAKAILNDDAVAAQLAKLVA